MKALTGRSPMKSPGAPALRRDVERLFWREIASGLTSEDAALAVGVSQSGWKPVVPAAWRHAVVHGRPGHGPVPVVPGAGGDRATESSTKPTPPAAISAV
jgi:hypothetical protein